jgi:hypothetical protein
MYAGALMTSALITGVVLIGQVSMAADDVRIPVPGGTIIIALPLVVFFAAVTQVKIQLTPVFLVFPDMLIDALVTDKGDAILRQTAADLIRTPLLLRHGRHSAQDRWLV